MQCLRMARLDNKNNTRRTHTSRRYTKKGRQHLEGHSLPSFPAYTTKSQLLEVAHSPQWSTCGLSFDAPLFSRRTDNFLRSHAPAHTSGLTMRIVIRSSFSPAWKRGGRGFVNYVRDRPTVRLQLFVSTSADPDFYSSHIVSEMPYRSSCITGISRRAAEPQPSPHTRTQTFRSRGVAVGTRAVCRYEICTPR